MEHVRSDAHCRSHASSESICRTMSRPSGARVGVIWSGLSATRGSVTCWWSPSVGPLARGVHPPEASPEPRTRDVCVAPRRRRGPPRHDVSGSRAHRRTVRCESRLAAVFAPAPRARGGATRQPAPLPLALPCLYGACRIGFSLRNLWRHGGHQIEGLNPSVPGDAVGQHACEQTSELSNLIRDVKHIASLGGGRVKDAHAHRSSHHHRGATWANCRCDKLLGSFA